MHWDHNNMPIDNDNDCSQFCSLPLKSTEETAFTILLLLLLLSAAINLHSLNILFFRIHWNKHFCSVITALCTGIWSRLFSLIFRHNFCFLVLACLFAADITHYRAYNSLYSFVQCYIFMFRTMYIGLCTWFLFFVVATAVEIIIITHNTNNFLIYDPFLCHCFVCTHSHTVLNVIPFGINNSHSNIVWVFVHFMVGLHHVDKLTSESLDTQTHNSKGNNSNNNGKNNERTTKLQAVHKTHTQANGRTRDTHFPHKMFTLCKFLWMSRRKTKKSSSIQILCGKSGSGGDVGITIFNSYLNMQTGSANSVWMMKLGCHR